MISSSPKRWGLRPGRSYRDQHRSRARRGRRDGRDQESRKSRRLCQRGDNPEVVRALVLAVMLIAVLTPRRRVRRRRQSAPGPGQQAGASPRGRRAGNPRTGRMAPAFAELVKAHKRGDRAALARVADRMGPGPARARRSASREPGVGEAALAALPLAHGGVLLIGAATDQIASSDWPRAAAAATALGALLDGAVPTALEEWEVPPDVVARACAALRALAWRSDAALATRLAALDAVAAAAPSCGSGADLAPLARDGTPALRRAATVVAAVGSERETVLRDAIADGDRGGQRRRRRRRRAGSRRAPGRTARPSRRRRRRSRRRGRWRRRRRRRPRTRSRCSTAWRRRERRRIARCWTSFSAGRRRRCAIAPSSSACGRRRESRDGGGDAGAGQRASGHGRRRRAAGQRRAAAERADDAVAPAGPGARAGVRRHAGRRRYSDAFLAAFRIPNLLRDLFAEGALSTAFVPTYVATLAAESRAAAFALANRVMSTLTIYLGLVALVGDGVPGAGGAPGRDRASRPRRRRCARRWSGS